MSRSYRAGAGLPLFAAKLLASCPIAGGGVHQWLFRTARVLHAFHQEKGRIVELLAQASATCGREVLHSEIEAAVANSEACAWRPGAGASQRRSKASHTPPSAPQESSRGWPEPNQEQIDAVVAASGLDGLADLWEVSPVRFDSGEPVTEELIDALFPDNPLLCCGWHVNRDFGTGTREEWRGKLAGMQFIVPSTMSAEEGRKRNSEQLSVRTLANTGPRRFLVIEFDRGMVDAHAGLLWHLARLAPLVMAVHSGGKSLHGWFSCAGANGSLLLRFMRYAVSLGADPATWTRCQFVRMPDGLRPRAQGTTVRQRVYYFNPENLP